MSPLASDPIAGTLPTSSTDVAAPFSSSDTDVQSLHSSSSIIRDIITHLGTTYAWAWFENPEEVENVDGYRPGDYHPTHIGDKFHNDTYVVLNKLGHGASSTGWLAQNTLIDGEYVALKILKAEASKTANEHNIRAHLQSKSNPRHPGHAYVTSSQSEVVRFNLQTCKQFGLPTWTFPIKTSRAIAAQVILGLPYLQSLGVCHGDLNLNNILRHRPFRGLC